MTALVYGFVHAASRRLGQRRDPRRRSPPGSCCWPRSSSPSCAPTSPITPLRLFADRNRSSSYLARLLLVAGMMGMFFFLTQFLRGVLGYSDLTTGFAFLPLTADGVRRLAAVSARVLVDRVGAHRLMIVGITFSTLGHAAG